MRHLVSVVLLGGCLIPEQSTFVKLDDRYIAAPTTNDVELYIDSPPPRRFRVVGTIHVGYIADPGAEPIIVAKRARKYGCDLVTTELVGAVAVAEEEAPLFRHASWSGSGGSSGGSSGRSSGGSSGGGYSRGGGSYSSSGTAPTVRRSYYCGIYIDPAPAPEPVPPAADEQRI